MDASVNDLEVRLEKDNLSGENKGLMLPNQQGRYLTASSLKGDKVVNPGGEHLGEIKEIMLDLQGGNIDYFVIEFGGFLGLGVKYFAVPFRLLQLDAPKKCFIFSVSRDVLEKAPGFDMDHWPDTNLHFEDVHSYWRFI